MEEQNLLVSIACITYNQEKFIAKAIEGFLMQQTNFNFEIVIGNDCSTDGTTEVLESYQKRYPLKIRVLHHKKNVGCHQNMVYTHGECKGKYIALCEGDDYWTDPLKLQKQVDFLENNPDYVMCCHYTRVIDSDGNTLYVDPNPTPLTHTYYGLLCGRQKETKTASLVFHNLPDIYNIYNNPWYFKCFAGDKMLKIFTTYKTGRKIYVMPEVMSCYRNHVDGIWSMIKDDSRTEMMISDFNLIIEQFTYPARLKKHLLMLYLKRYALFELRRHRIRKAYQTVKSLI